MIARTLRERCAGRIHRDFDRATQEFASAGSRRSFGGPGVDAALPSRPLGQPHPGESRLPADSATMRACVLRLPPLVDPPPYPLVYSLAFTLSGIAMYAVIKTGGKQYRVNAGDEIKVEKLDAHSGAEVVLDEVLLIADGDQVTIGKPLIDGAAVRATVLGQGRGEKIRIFKMRRRKHYRKTQGHRQSFTSLRIDSISPAG